MSKHSNAKLAQNYRMTHDACANCGNYESQFVVKIYDAWNGKQTWTEEKGKRCSIGGFPVNKTAVCDLHVLVVGE